MTTTEQLAETIAALEAQLNAEDPTIGELREALEGCGPRTQIPIRSDDLLEDQTLQTRSPSLSPAPTHWLGLRG